MQFLDLTGKQFRGTTVLGFSSDRLSGKRMRKWWVCQCSCGNIFEARTDALTGGSTVSCGCRRNTQAIGNKYTYKHGEAGTKLYKLWSEMKRRCNNPADACYYRYGGRGITVCSEWHDFVPFRDWSLNNGYAEGLTLDRMDNDGNYEPSNCRWATQLQQQNNKRTNHMIACQGKTQSLTMWAREVGISQSALRKRIVGLRWDTDKALSTPLRKR